MHATSGEMSEEPRLVDECLQEEVGMDRTTFAGFVDAVDSIEKTDGPVEFFYL